MYTGKIELTIQVNGNLREVDISFGEEGLSLADVKAAREELSRLIEKMEGALKECNLPTSYRFE